MIIDMHTHLFMGGDMPKEHLKATARRWAYARKPFRDPNDVLPRIMPGLTDADGSLFFADMAAFGIDASVAHVLDYQWGLQSEQDTPIDELNRRYGKLQRTHPGRFYAFAGVDHRRPDAMDLFERAIKEYGLRGYKIYPATGFDPNDPALEPFFRRCVEWEIPVLTHTSGNSFPHIGRLSNPDYLQDVVVRFPDLMLILGHAGHGPYLEQCLAVAGGAMNCYLELGGWQHEAFRDLGGFVKTLARMRDTVGAHRILWGSDRQSGPRFSGERTGIPRWLQIFKDLPRMASEYDVSFTQEEVDMMLGGNAARILGLDGGGAKVIGQWEAIGKGIDF